MAYVENNSTSYTLRVKGLKDITFMGRVNKKGILIIPEEGVYEIHVRYEDRGLALLHRGLIRKDDQMVFSHEDVGAQVKRTKKYVMKMAEINKAKEETDRQKLKEAMELEAVMKKMAPLSVGSAGGSSGASTSSRVEKKAPAAPAPAAANMYDVPSDESDLDFGSDDE
jgi:hypothetical protein